MVTTNTISHVHARTVINNPSSTRIEFLESFATPMAKLEVSSGTTSAGDATTPSSCLKASSYSNEKNNITKDIMDKEEIK